MAFYKIKDAISDFKKGKFVIVIDDKHRENEADIVLAAEKCSPEKINFMIRNARGLVCVPMLGKHEITSVMIEGGSQLNSSAIKEGVVDKALIFAAPKIIGNGIGAIGSLGIKKIDKAINLKNPIVKKIGKDVLIEGYL